MRDSMQLSISPPEEDEAMRSKALEPISFESTCQKCGKSETYQGLFKLVVYTCRACEAEAMQVKVKECPMIIIWPDAPLPPPPPGVNS